MTLDEAEKLADALEALLLDFGIVVATGSDLERLCLAPLEARRELRLDGQSSFDTYRQFAGAAGLAELAAHLVAVREHPSFQNLVPHLHLLNHGDPGQAGPAKPSDQAARKIFELFVGAIAMRIADDVELEHPVHGSPNNPDVALAFSGRRWGLACKVPTSAHPESLIQNIEKAVEQVEESGVDRGLPFFSLRNVIPPEHYWRPDPDDPSGGSFKIFSEPAPAIELLLDEVAELWRGVERHTGGNTFREVLKSPRCGPGVLSHVHVLAPIVHGREKAATSIRFVSFYHVGRHEPCDEAISQALHKAATFQV